MIFIITHSSSKRYVLFNLMNDAQSETVKDLYSFFKF